MSDDSIICCCASCGIAEIDDIKLKPCDGCDLVKYCRDDCQRDHKSEHEEECKQRADELRDELLFKHPVSTYLGDCPICSLPLPLDQQKSIMMSCCSKTICKGCCYAKTVRDTEQSLVPSCPFCRQPTPKTDEEVNKLRMKRIEADDPVAITAEGFKQYMNGDYIKAFDYYTKAAALGDVDAHYRLADMYREGEGIEKNEGKMIYHWEEAAIGGHPFARHNLGYFYEWMRGEKERTMKHWIISAAQGYDTSIKALMIAFKKEYISKEDLATALRAHKAAVDATKSPQRKEAEELSNQWKEAKEGNRKYNISFD